MGLPMQIMGQVPTSLLPEGLWDVVRDPTGVPRGCSAMLPQEHWDCVREARGRQATQR